MNVELLSLACDSGHASPSLVQVALTSDHQLVFHWWCEECDEPVYAFKSLAECWRECPSNEQAEIEVAEEPLETTGSITELEDSVFLSAVGIAFPVDVK